MILRAHHCLLIALQMENEDQRKSKRDCSPSLENTSLENTKMEMLLTTRISVNSSARNFQEMHLQALRERLVQETKNFFDQVNKSDGDVCKDKYYSVEDEPVSPQLLVHDEKDYEEDYFEESPASPDTSRQFFRPSATKNNEGVEGNVTDEATDCTGIKPDVECQHQEVNTDDNCMSDAVSRSPTPLAMERARSAEEDSHFATVLRRREELLRQKRAAIPSNPPALLRTLPVSETILTTEAEPQTVMRNRDSEEEKPDKASGVPVVSDAVVESLREVASLKPELGDIDLLSLGMKANASRILAQYSIPLPLGGADSVRRKARRKLPPVPYAPPYVQPYNAPYPQRYPASAISTPYVPVGLPVVPSFRPAPRFLIRQGHDGMHCPPLWQPAHLVHSQRPVMPIASTIRGACPTHFRSSLINSLPFQEERNVLTPERYFQQIVAAVPPIGTNTVTSSSPVQFDAHSTQQISQLEPDEQENRRIDIDLVQAQIKGTKEDRNISSVSSQENSPTPSGTNEDSGLDSIGVRSLMATSERHQVNIRRFMSRLPDQYRRKPHRRSSVSDKTKCDICGKVMARKGLMVHRRIHVGDRRFKCDICGRSFTQACNMRTHLKVHFKVKEHKCSYCGKVFSRAQHLYEHERIHTGERPYVCRFCGCSFKAYSTLYSHIGTHTGHKYECQACHRTFAKACNLETHIRSKHAGDPGALAGLRRIGGSESSSRDSASPELTTQAQP